MLGMVCWRSRLIAILRLIAWQSSSCCNITQLHGNKIMTEVRTVSQMLGWVKLLLVQELHCQGGCAPFMSSDTGCSVDMWVLKMVLTYLDTLDSINPLLATI